MSFMIIISTETSVSVHTELEKHEVQPIIRSAFDDESVEVFEYIREVPLEEFN